MRTVLITGAEGFTGNRLLTHFATHGYDVVAGVRNRARKLNYERQERRALVCDVTDPINVARVIASVRPGAVVHLGGMASAADAAREPLEAYQSIAVSWANILDAVRRAVPRAKVVLASACDVYGNSGAGGQPLAETAATNPLSTFGSWKLLAESIAHTFFRDFHVDVTIARPFHCVGSGQPNRFYFGALLKKLAEDGGPAAGTTFSWPDLNCVWDLLHVDDVVMAYERLVEQGRPCETYNICSGNAQKCQDVAELMASALGRHVTFNEAAGAHDKSRIAVLRGDNRKLTELGWQPRRSVAEAVQEAARALQTAKPLAAV